MQDLNTRFQQAANLHQQGQLPAAAALYREILQDEPAFTPALNMLGILTAQNGQPEAAIEFFNTAIRLSPADPAPLENLGRTLAELRRFTDAAASYKRALAINPDSFPALYGLATSTHAAENYAESLPLFEQALGLRPDDITLHLYAGAAHQQLQQLDRAEDRYRRALVIDDKSLDALTCLANLLLIKHDYTEAETTFARIIELGGQRADIEFGYAQTLEHRGDEAAALQHYVRACELDPSSQNAYIQLDQFLLKSGGPEKQTLLQRLASDHVYSDWQDSVDDLRELAGLYSYPDRDAMQALHAFIDVYKPGELHDKNWWQQQLQSFGGPDHTHDKLLRSLHSAVYCWSLPDRETLQAIAEFAGDTRICSYGAGSGLWERLLQDHFDCRVAASDLLLRHRFMPMTSIDYSQTGIGTGDTIFVAWIVRGDTGIMNILQQMQPGQKLVLTGEPPDSKGIPRICGTPKMWDFLAENFNQRGQLPLVNYSLLNDNVCLFDRKQDTET